MRIKVLTAFACFCLIAACATKTGAQSGGRTAPAPEPEAATEAGARPADATDDSPYDLKRGTYEIGAWGGFSPGSTTFFGRSPDRRLLLTAYRAGRVMGTKKHFAFEMTVDVIPFARLTNGERFTFRGVSFSAGPPEANGVGLSPIGLKFLFRRRSRVKPFVAGTAGFLFFERAVPYDAARRFNYTFDGGAGLQILSRSRHATTVGYKFHHLSNAYTRDVNPGVDSHVFYVGFSLFR